MRRRLDTRGTTALEFAVSIMVVLTLVFAVFNLGRVFADQHALNYAVEKAVRYAVVNSTSATTTTIKNQFVTAITPAVGAAQAGKAVVSVSFSPAEKVGATVTVSATLAWTPVTTLADLTAVTLRSSQTLTIQH